MQPVPQEIAQPLTNNVPKGDQTMKKTLYMLGALALVTSLATTVLAQGISGTVTKVRGDKVTIEVSRQEAANISVGDQATLTITPKAAQAPAAGNDMLTGC
jgi:preprotein translocase subunit YajC